MSPTTFTLTIKVIPFCDPDELSPIWMSDLNLSGLDIGGLDITIVLLLHPEELLGY